MTPNGDTGPESNGGTSDGRGPVSADERDRNPQQASRRSGGPGFDSRPPLDSPAPRPGGEGCDHDSQVVDGHWRCLKCGHHPKDCCSVEAALARVQALCDIADMRTTGVHVGFVRIRAVRAALAATSPRPPRQETTMPDTGADLIAIERRRQITEEGWTPEHDAAHGGELVQAALCYIEPDYLGAVPVRWPWEPSSYKPTPDDRVRELVKAAALIAAEIDRLRARRQ